MDVNVVQRIFVDSSPMPLAYLCPADELHDHTLAAIAHEAARQEAVDWAAQPALAPRAHRKALDDLLDDAL